MSNWVISTYLDLGIGGGLGRPYSANSRSGCEVLPWLGYGAAAFNSCLAGTALALNQSN